MTERLQLVAWITEQEFRGESFNSKPLVELLASISAEDAASTATYEGYSIWAIVLHLAYWKYYLTQALGGDADEFPYEEADWPSVPRVADGAAWDAARAYLASIHDRYMATLETLPDKRLDEVYDRWKTPFFKLIAWMSTHDAFHGAQIRNMGAPGIKPRRAGTPE